MTLLGAVLDSLVRSIVFAAAIVPPVGQTPPVAAAPGNAGRAAYVQHCATCHGADLRGGPNAPSLRGVGAADVDFWVGTGRMPAAVPWLQVDHRGPQLGATTIAAIVRYVSHVAPGGPPIPDVVTNGDARRGEALFRENCEHCHGATSEGAAIGEADWAPSLARASVVQIAEAIRVGPGEMPQFNEAQLSPHDVDDVATYLAQTRARDDTPRLPAPSSGPLPEGFLGWLCAGSLALAAYAFSAPSSSSKEPPA